MGMVGGGQGAFIGAVHRMAAQLDHEAVFTAGALSSTPEKAIASGRALNLPDDRIYKSWRDMLDRERDRPVDERIDFISIVTPNTTHFEIARACLEAGFHVVIDKPMVTSRADAEALIETVEESGCVCAVTYNYSGYPLIRQARELVHSGELGEIRKVIVEYHQGWLATLLERAGNKQASWRLDPAQAGLGGAIGDIGSHAEQLVAAVTGLDIESICADLTSFGDGRALDDDAAVLLRFNSGARGSLSATQIATGEENNLVLRVWGTKAGITWRQEQPNELLVKLDGRPQQVYRPSHEYLGDAAKRASRLPPGHPEAFIEAFANVYRNAFAAMRSDAKDRSGNVFDYPDVHDGARGVRFIEAVVRSAASNEKWTPF